MTNDRAAEIMKAIIFIIPHEYYSDEVEEAIHMGINALQAQEVSNDSPELDKENGELIRRKAAIDVLYKNYILGRGDLNEVLDHIVDRLEKLPSAQPAPCDFCKHNNIADDKVCLMCSAERRTDG